MSKEPADMRILLHHCPSTPADQSDIAGLDPTGWPTGWRATEPQPLRPILITLCLITLLLLTWAAVQVA